jgi:hypothetical protein
MDSKEMEIMVHKREDITARPRIRQCSLLVVCLGALTTLAGCEPPRTSSTSPGPAEDVAAPQPRPAVEPAEPVEMVREPAAVGVGKRGEDIPAEPRPVDIITTPTNIYFQAQEQVVFQIQIPQAMSLYKASEGQAPRSEEEFFEKIIQANNIKLPELPSGHRYVYDPATEQLLVEHPK